MLLEMTLSRALDYIRKTHSAYLPASLKEEQEGEEGE